MLKLIIQRAIASIRTMMGGATPTQPAGLVPQEPTTPDGKVTSALDTQNQRLLSPARPRSQKKQKPAQSTIQASKNTSKKQKPVATAKSRKVDGSSTPTPASKTRQHVKQAAKPKR